MEATLRSYLYPCFPKPSLPKNLSFSPMCSMLQTSNRSFEAIVVITALAITSKTVSFPPLVFSSSLESFQKEAWSYY